MVTTVLLAVGTVSAKASAILCLPPFGPGTSDSLIACSSDSSTFIAATGAQESPEKLFSLTTLSSSDLRTDQPLTYVTDGSGPNAKISDIFGVFEISKEHESESSKGYDYLSWFKSSDSSGSQGCSTWDLKCQKDEEDKNTFVLGFISDPTGDAFKDFCATEKDYWGEGSKSSNPCVSAGPERFATIDASRYLSSDSKYKAAAFISDVDAVPEPATTGLFFGIAALGLCIWKRRSTA
jgi:hypothetical protein